MTSNSGITCRNLNDSQVLVIGRGFGGLAVAEECLLRRKRPILVGQDRGASHCAQGISQIKGLITPKTDLFKAKIEGHFALEKLCLRLKITIHRGVYEPIFSVDDFNKTTSRIYKGEPWGLFGTEFSTNENLIPYLNQPIGHLFYPNDFCVNPETLLQKWEDSLHARGAEIIRCSIDRVTRDRGVFELKTDTLWLRTKNLAIAAGSNIGEFCQQLSLKIPELIELHGESYYWENSVSPSPIAICKGVVNAAMIDTSVRIGSSQHLRLSEIDSERDQRSILEKMQINLPDNVTKVFRGTRIRTKSREPILLSKKEGDSIVVVVGGFYKSGMQLCHSYAIRALDRLEGKEQ